MNELPNRSGLKLRWRRFTFMHTRISIVVRDERLDRMERNRAHAKSRLKPGREASLPKSRRRSAIYEAFVEGQTEEHLARSVHGLYFEPSTKNSAENDLKVSANPFTSAFEELDPITQFKATAKLGGIPGGEVLSVVFSWEGGTGRPAPSPSASCPLRRCHSRLALSFSMRYRDHRFHGRTTKRILSHSNVLATLSFQFKGLSVSVPLCLLRSVTLVIFPTLAPVYSAIHANCVPASQAAEYQQLRWLVGEEHMVRADSQQS